MNISVVIPTINRQKSLAKTVRSVLGGSMLPNEIIVVEQGSIEETQRCLATFDFGGVNVKVVFLDVASSSQARNLGVKESSGDILFFFDDDIEISKGYIDVAYNYLKRHKNILGLTGSYISKAERCLTFKKIIGIFFMMYSAKCENTVLRSGAYDYIRGRSTSKDRSVEWLYGCNMVLKRKVFDDFCFPKTFIGASFGEDVFFSYEIHKKHPGSLRYLHNLVLKHNKETIGKHTSEKLIRMKIIYRYIFWKSCVHNENFINLLCYLWSQIGIIMLQIFHSPSFKTLRNIFASYMFILKYGKKMKYPHEADCADIYNNFINTGQNGSGRKFFLKMILKRITSNPAYLPYFIKRQLIYKRTSYQYVKFYENIKILNESDTLRHIIDNDLSVARFNDGEYQIIKGAGIFPEDSDWSQKYDKKLETDLRKILNAREDGLLIAHTPKNVLCINKQDAAAEGVLYSMHTEARMLLYKYLKEDVVYGASTVFDVLCNDKNGLKLLTEYLSNKNILIVTGNVGGLKTVNFGKDVFFLDTNIKHNAYDKIAYIEMNIENKIKELGLEKEDVLVMISMGVTATVMTYNLHLKGYRVWDTGHFFSNLDKCK